MTIPLHSSCAELSVYVNIIPTQRGCLVGETLFCVAEGGVERRAGEQGDYQMRCMARYPRAGRVSLPDRLLVPIHPNDSVVTPFPRHGSIWLASFPLPPPLGSAQLDAYLLITLFLGLPCKSCYYY